MELLTHGGEHHEIGDGGWLMMTMATDSPLRSPEWTPLDGERFSLWSLAFMVMMAPPGSSSMPFGDDGPLWQGAREGLDWFSMATKASGGGTPDLG